jgi:hypothetical protein
MWSEGVHVVEVEIVTVAFSWARNAVRKNDGKRVR